MTARPFKDGDRVTVHNFIVSGLHKGRVVCTNRENKYGLCVVVLVDQGKQREVIESFTKEGKRYGAHDKCYITLGWPKNETSNK